MNVRCYTILVAVSVICVLLSLLQYYHYNYNKLTAVKLYDPLFKDLIPSDRYVNNIEHKLDILDIINSYKKVSVITKNNIYTSETEVDNCLKAALAYKLSGKNDKALRLFEHAAAIAPENPDVLNIYGEYLEHNHEDVISADELYFKVIFLNYPCRGITKTLLIF